MNKLAGSDLLKLDDIRTQIEARDREIDNPYVKDAQVMNLHNARRYIGDRLIRTRQAAPHPRSRAGPADRGEAQHPDPQDAGRLRDRSRLPRVRQRRQDHPRPLCGGEAAGFGGGGVHGYRSLEGTFLGGCLFSGRNAGRAAAKAV